MTAAAGLDIAGFNGRIALGSRLGAGVIDAFGLSATALASCDAALLGLVCLSRM